MIKLINLLSKIIKNLDIIVAYIGLVILLILIPIILLKGFHNIYFVVIGIGFICITIYIAIRGKIQSIAFQLVNNNWYICIILFCICLIGLSQLWIINLQYPNSLIGLDPWTHQRITTQELEIALNQAPNQYGIGHIKWDTIGGYFSLMHLYLKLMMDIFNINYKWASLIFWSSFQTILTIIFVYFNGKELMNKTVGLLASFFVSVASCVVYFNEWSIPNSFGVISSLIILYLFIKAHKTKRYWLVWVSFIFVPLSLFTHVLAAIWVVGVIVCLNIGMFIFNLLNKETLVSIQ